MPQYLRTKMKIALVTPSYPPTQIGGAEVSVKLLADSLTERGYEVVVLAFDGDKRAEEGISGVRVVRHQRIKGLTDIAQTLTLIPKVVRAMRQWQSKVDLFHIYNLFPLSGAGMYKALGGKRPVIATFNSYTGFCPLSSALCPSNKCNFSQRVRCLAEGRGPAHKALSIPYATIYPILILLMKRADRYIALSQVIKDIYVEHGYNADRIDVIPNFVEEQIDSSVFNHVSKPHTFNILYVGKLHKGKGVDILIKAFSQLAKDNSRVQLTIVGDGLEGEALKRLAAELEIDKQVVFAGEVSHKAIWRYYQAADVFVHPAIWAEPFGRIILEAMQFHLPLIVSDAGAPPEIVGDAGLVFERGNVDDLTQKLELIYRDEKLRQRLSLNCPKVLQAYGQDKIIDRIVMVYQRVLDRQ